MQNFLQLFSDKKVEEKLLEKFLRYVVIDTQSQEGVDCYPSTAKQWDLINLLVKELKELGIDNTSVDKYGYVIATIPSNIPKTDATFGKVPVLALIAHVDTAPGVSGANVKPQIIKNYSGEDLVLPGDNSVVIRVAENPQLKAHVGQTIITTDGTTLLGGDNKAGIAIIMTLAELLLQNTSIPHGEIKIVFTPDEEVGAGTKFFDVEKLGAQFAYTVDGEVMGELNKETFSANTAIVNVHGRDIHPGKAKNIMVNAVRVASDIVSLLPKNMAPETTENYEPYLHPYVMEGNVSEAVVKILLRDFVTDGLDKLKTHIEKAIAIVQKDYPEAIIELKIIEAYRNMRGGLEKDMRVVDYLWEAATLTGVNPCWEPIRGGTDGSQLTTKGLPTPNIFVGGANFHSKTEWVAVYGMMKAVETIGNLLQIWVEKNK